MDGPTRGPANEIFTKFKPRQQSRGALVVSILAHALFILVLGSLIFHYPIQRLLSGPDRAKEPPAERIRYVRMAPVGGIGADTGVAGAPRSAPPPAAGTSRRPGPAAPLTAPSSVPTQLPPTTSTGGSVGGVKGGSGSGGGDGSGAVTGVTPSYGDPRVWAEPGPFVALPRSPAQKADSVVRDAFRSYYDSAAVAARHPERAPGDWTVEKGGQKWGVDQKWVHLGKVKIPTAVLALLPLNVQGNPQEMDRQRAQRYMRQDILFQANRAVSEDEFRDAVKRIRERKDRERREQERAAKDVRP
ncbi:MAG TPA: hypothetical protein VEA99_01990 [Gemmatimonadaceae bacterium]|nr:hypothetical protein [Gemmatimonadaceae bacterium]